VTRTLGSYAEYYGRWLSPWESQALLRARPLEALVGAPFDGEVLPDGAQSRAVTSGDPLAQRFTAVIDPVRYPDGGLSPADLREIRRIKARVEAERLPRGIDPSRHLKLGPGAVADIEWTAQLLQLQYAHVFPGLRTTGTLAALDAAVSAGVIDAEDGRALSEAWLLASRLRSAVVLWSGRTSGAQVDVLPHDRRSLAGVARLVGDASGSEVAEKYLRTARRARAVVERVFYRSDG
jgi:glutamate-ammonia-ligase adenylyltransferase